MDQASSAVLGSIHIQSSSPKDHKNYKTAKSQASVSYSQLEGVAPIFELERTHYVSILMDRLVYMGFSAAATVIPIGLVLIAERTQLGIFLLFLATGFISFSFVLKGDKKRIIPK